MTSELSILARMTTRAVSPAADVPLTSSRALRVAMTRAADKSLGLSLTVSSVVEEMLANEELIDALPSQYLFAALIKHEEIVGILGVDTQMRAAAIEIQTMGRLANIVAQDRLPTGTDMMMLAPLCEELLEQLRETTDGSDLEGWGQDVVLGPVFESLRAAGLAMKDADFRLMRLSIDLGVAERKGEVVLAMPNHRTLEKVELVKVADQSWDKKMHEAVSSAPAVLDAILHKMTLPLGQVNAFCVGDTLPLLGATVGTVQLFAPNRVMVIEARLGQSGGKRAVRIEKPDAKEMRDLPAPQARVASEIV